MVVLGNLMAWRRARNQPHHGRAPCTRSGNDATCAVVRQHRPVASARRVAVRSPNEHASTKRWLMTTTTLERPAERSGTFTIGGDVPVHRLGFGSMQLTGPGVWGNPKDPAEAVRVLKRAVELGVTLIDTADSYGPYVAEDLIRKALYPYPTDLVIATKAGLTRGGPGKWDPVGRPEYLRQEAEMSLRRLGLDR